MRRSRLPISIAFVAATAAVLVPATGVVRAFAATITVNTSADELNSDGDCSLREAVQSANTDSAVDLCTAGSGADTINFASSTNGHPINLTSPLDLTTKVTINGNGRSNTVVQGDEIDVAPPGSLTVSPKGVEILVSPFGTELGR